MADTITTGSDLAAAQGGDAGAFERLVSPWRRELHAHCYRMLGSTHDADDVLQETLVKAWRGLGGFEGRSSVRTWLHTVATRCCLDAVRDRARRALPVDLGPAATATVVADVARHEVAWLQPYPLTGLPDSPAGPAARYEQREAVELAFVAALQHLPGNQRAALLLFDVLGLSAAEIAAVMQTSAASVNSALQRARAVVADRVPPRAAQRSPRVGDDRRARELAGRFAGALEDGDADALVALLTEDVTWAMPPLAGWYAGIARVADFARQVPLGACGAWRAQVVEANGRPGVALWLRPPGGDTFAAWAVTVLDARGDGIAAVTSFLDAAVFPTFGLPDTR